jgi:uncharacterized protein (TIGR00299 family) protein
MTRVAYIDAPAGCSGDMFLGALVDAGLPLAVLEEVVDGLGLQGVELHVTRVERGALAATKVDVCKDGSPIEGAADVHLHDHDHAHGRTLADVLHVIGHLGDLSLPPLDKAAATFRHLAEAEARVHGRQPSDVHFHEVGAADALVDVVGTCVGLHHLGVEAVHVSPLPWSRGTVETQHGTLPLPAPATALLLEGHPTVSSEETYEQVTPTGAALVRALASGSRPPDGFVPRTTGFGAGTYNRSRLPNVLRLVLGDVEHAAGREDVVLLETNLDDATGQVVAYAVERLLAAGALDAWWTPIAMKKGRPGILLSALVQPEAATRIEDVLFRETPTLGVRRRRLERRVLPRSMCDVSTPWGTVRMKVREGPDGAQATPEFEDCRAIAEKHGVAVHAVIRAAARAWAEA